MEYLVVSIQTTFRWACRCRILLLVSSLLFPAANANSQRTQWINSLSMSGAEGNRLGGQKTVALDSIGNFHVTGSAWNGTQTIQVTAKFGRDGTQEWVSAYSVPGALPAVGKALAVDAFGNVYVTGVHTNPETYSNNIHTVKYTAAGVQAWVAIYSAEKTQSTGRVQSRLTWKEMW